MLRLIAILLTFVSPIQGMGMPHGHGEGTSGVPVGHDSTPHVHFGHSHPHTHSHHGEQPEDSTRPEDSSHEHDENAIEVAGHDSLHQLAVSFSLCLTEGIWESANTFGCDCLGVTDSSTLEPPPDVGSVPIYLSTASLRL
jgi:hypothetical protein